MPRVWHHPAHGEVAVVGAVGQDEGGAAADSPERVGERAGVRDVDGARGRRDRVVVAVEEGVVERAGRGTGGCRGRRGQRGPGRGRAGRCRGARQPDRRADPGRGEHGDQRQGEGVTRREPGHRWTPTRHDDPLPGSAVQGGLVHGRAVPCREGGSATRRRPARGRIYPGRPHRHRWTRHDHLIAVSASTRPGRRIPDDGHIRDGTRPSVIMTAPAARGRTLGERAGSGRCWRRDDDRAERRRRAGRRRRLLAARAVPGLRGDAEPGAAGPVLALRGSGPG